MTRDCAFDLALYHQQLLQCGFGEHPCVIPNNVATPAVGAAAVTAAATAGVYMVGQGYNTQQQ